MKVTWQKFGWVEVQVFQPDTPSDSTILFCPGFPGMGGAMFEQRHAAALTDAGYNLYVIHHKGTRTNGALSPASINHGARLQTAWEDGETHLGGGAASAQDLLDEPLIVLKAIADTYKNIHVVGNSFGALSSLSALTSHDAPVDKVKTLVLLAGAQGVVDGTDGDMMRIWKPEYILNPAIAAQIEMDDAVDAVATLRNLYQELPHRVIDKLPAHIKLTYVVVEKDELLKLSDTEQFKLAVGGRGDIVMDYDEGYPAFGITPHYTANYKTKDLLALIRG